MKFLFLGIIRAYWLIFPAGKRRACLFEESCSVHVYRITDQLGFIKGMKALRKRFQQCRPGYSIIKDFKTDAYELHLKNGTVIKQDEISKRLLP